MQSILRLEQRVHQSERHEAASLLGGCLVRRDPDDCTLITEVVDEPKQLQEPVESTHTVVLAGGFVAPGPGWIHVADVGSAKVCQTR